MNQELLWLSSRIDELDSTVQKIRWYMQELEEYRQELTLMWNDSCSLEISQRFIEPMASESDLCLKDLDHQVEYLRECATALNIVDAKLCQAACSSDEIYRLSLDLKSMFTIISSLISDVMNEINQASDCISQAYSLVAQANSIGR